MKKLTARQPWTHLFSKVSSNRPTPLLTALLFLGVFVVIVSFKPAKPTTTRKSYMEYFTYFSDWNSPCNLVNVPGNFPDDPYYLAVDPDNISNGDYLYTDASLTTIADPGVYFYYHNQTAEFNRIEIGWAGQVISTEECTPPREWFLAFPYEYKDCSYLSGSFPWPDTELYLNTWPENITAYLTHIYYDKACTNPVPPGTYIFYHNETAEFNIATVDEDGEVIDVYVCFP